LEGEKAMTKASQPSTKNDCPVPIASSKTLGWEAITVEEFQQPSGEAAYQACSQHTIALSLNSRPKRLYQAIGERHFTGLYRQGDLSITPAGIPSAYRSEEDDCYLWLCLPPEFLQQIAREAMEINSEHIELTPQLRAQDPHVEQILMMLRLELHKGGGAIGRLYVESLTNALAVHLLRDYSTIQPRVAIYEAGLRERDLLKVTEYIRAHLAQDIKLKELAQLLNMSQFHFSRSFKKSMGSSPHQYLLQQRVEQAKKLLKQTKLSIVEIAIECGFNSHSHFGKQFRLSTGIAPKNYRRAN
jgi:AraC family transcriptional regulator